MHHISLPLLIQSKPQAALPLRSARRESLVTNWLELQAHINYSCGLPITKCMPHLTPIMYTIINDP